MKRIIASLLAWLLLFSLAACGGKAEEKEATAATEVAPQKNVEAEKQQEETQPKTNGAMVTLEALMNAAPAQEDQFTYSGSEENGFIIKTYKGTDNLLVIPAERRNVPIVSVAKYALGSGVAVEAVRFNDNTPEVDELVCATNEALKIVVLGTGTKKIDESAFQHCKSLETVILNDGLQEIARSAFLSCGNLKEIEIPATVTNIDPAAFWACHEDFTIYGTAGSYAETYAAENGIPFVAK